MPTWKLPPRAKVYEALTAVADHRVILGEKNEAEVWSSDRTKSYLIRWNDEKTAFGSNDNASYWQGYIGYPIIATLMVMGRIAYSKPEAQALSGVEWKKLNDRHKRDYEAVVGEVLLEAEKRGASRDLIESDVDSIYAQLRDLSLEMISVPRNARAATKG